MHPHIKPHTLIRPGYWLVFTLLAIGMVLSLGTGTAYAAGPSPGKVGPPPGKGGSQEWVEVIIQGRDLSAVPGLNALVQARGGQVTRRLGLINAVSARIPAHALERLQRAPGIRKVFPNRMLQIDSYASGVTVRDEFNGASFDNNDGSTAWAGAWVEDDVAGAGPTVGHIQVISGELCWMTNQTPEQNRGPREKLTCPVA